MPATVRLEVVVAESRCDLLGEDVPHRSRAGRAWTDVGTGAGIWGSDLAPPAPVVAATAKQNDQHDDYED